MTEIKQVIVVRTDLKMGKGKLAAQVAHGAVEAVFQILESEREEWREWLRLWRRMGQKKIVVKVQSERELREIYEKARDENLPAVIIADAGLTQLEPGTVTVVAIGPAPADKVDKITGKLKLL